MEPKSNKLVLLAAVLAVAAIAWFFLRDGASRPLVVYCAHDQVYAESVLRQFEKDSGIKLAIRYDSEATKSLGLVEQIIAERNAPRCDVFWNNQELGTERLREEGLLQSYKGPGYERIPAALKDPDGYWAGFGARLRVYIINTDKMPATEDAVAAKLAGPLDRVTVAKPLFGTTFVHYSAIWALDGEAALKKMHADWRARGVYESSGNAQCKNLVATGACDMGWTDSDDFFGALDEHKPVAMLPVRVSGKTVCSPNTVAIIKGTQKEAQARKLVDYLLSAENEIALANASSRQIPLGPVDETRIPEEVRRLKQWAADACPLGESMRAAPPCLAWLKAEYVK